jgi:hypothetical protein
MCYAGRGADFDALFDLEADPHCSHNLWHTDAAQRDVAIEKLIAAMRRLHVPVEHFNRLGLATST